MKIKTLDRRLITILLIVFVQMVGAAMILPILPLYAQREFGMSPQIITLLNTAFFGAQFLAGPYLGRLSDKHGRLPVLIVSQIGTAVSFLMIAFAPNVGMLFLARILDGITGGNIIVAQAYITDITPREKRTESLGYIFAMFGMGFIIGPALGSLSAAFFGPRIPYIFAAIAAALVVLLTWLTLDESLTPEQQEANRRYKKAGIAPTAVMQNFPLMLMLLIAFVGQFAMGLLQSTFSLYGEAVLFAEKSEKVVTLGIGLLLATIGASQFMTQAFLLRRALKRFREAALVIIGSILRTIGLLSFVVVPTPTAAMVGCIFFAMGMGLMMPSIQSLTTGTVDDEMRGGVLGVYQSTISLSTIFSTAVAGLLFAITPAVPFWISAAVSLAVVIPALVLLRNGRERRVMSNE